MTNERKVTVYSTNDYTIFKRLLGNREVKPIRKMKIVKSIQTRGYISCPIIVNEKMEVIDGQGRLEALKSLGLPVEYVIIKWLTIDDCTAMNFKDWNINDYVDCYAECGNENYIRFKDVAKQFELSYSILHSILVGRTNSGGRGQNELRYEMLKVSEEQYKELCYVCEYIMRYKEIRKTIGGSQRLFLSAIAWVASQENVDRERLFTSIKQQTNKILPVTKTEPLLRQISEVYNYGYPKKNRRMFDYEYSMQ